MLAQFDDTIVALRGARTIAIQRWTTMDYFAALRASGVREAAAAAASKGLITIDLRRYEGVSRCQ